MPFFITIVAPFWTRTAAEDEAGFVPLEDDDADRTAPPKELYATADQASAGDNADNAATATATTTTAMTRVEEPNRDIVSFLWGGKGGGGGQEKWGRR